MVRPFRLARPTHFARHRRGDGAVVGTSSWHNGSVPTTLEPTRVAEPAADERVAEDHPWIVLVWNDPVNLMSYVTFVLQKLFGYSLEKATELMLDVHNKGRAVVANGTREQAEMHVFRLHEHGLWATMEKDGVDE